MPAAFDVRSVTEAIIETLVNSVIRIQTIVNNIDRFEPYKQPQAETPVGSGFAVQLSEEPEQATPPRCKCYFPCTVRRSSNVRDPHLPALRPCDDTLGRPGSLQDCLGQAPARTGTGTLHQHVRELWPRGGAVGFSLGTTSLKLGRNIFSGMEQVKNGFCYQSTAPISPGNSDGPLFASDPMKRSSASWASTLPRRREVTRKNANYEVPTLHIRQVSRGVRSEENRTMPDARGTDACH